MASHFLIDCYLNPPLSLGEKLPPLSESLHLWIISSLFPFKYCHVESWLRSMLEAGLHEILLLLV